MVDQIVHSRKDADVPTAQHQDDPLSGWVSDEWEIDDADIDEVLNWAHDKAGGRRFVVHARVVGGEPGESGLVRLLGTDPLDELSGLASTSLEDRLCNLRVIRRNAELRACGGRARE